MLSITQTVFLEKPQTLYIDEDYSVKPRMKRSIS